MQFRQFFVDVWEGYLFCIWLYEQTATDIFPHQEYVKQLLVETMV